MEQNFEMFVFIFFIDFFSQSVKNHEWDAPDSYVFFLCSKFQFYCDHPVAALVGI